MLRAGLACALAMAFAAPAAAHVTATPDAGPAGGYFRTAFRISHGCEDAATVAVRLAIPEGIAIARPQAKPGWTVEIRKRPLPAPVEVGHGQRLTEAPAEIVWRGGPLPADQFDEFGLLLRLPDRPGETLWFAVTQECTAGSNAWSEVPKPGERWGDLHRPAPFIRLTPR